MTAQLELTTLPTADPAFERAALLELDLEAALAAVAVALDDDAQTAPTARNIAEHLWAEHPEDGEPWGGLRHRRALRLLRILRTRGAVLGRLDENGSCYISRDDEPARVMRWTGS